ncbi:alanyl-tRNA synthetase [Clostridium sp. USBA 49]|uniref:alanyl-tRNA editing protein n=1 Tax=Clostridium sp. USBA 49 TaxID=1881060 RepID=UPI00099927BF|nr:DHHA1 domain-containing protein [Clostridium sp. USBA 49]SKA81519.1 alanyl-tRNA synthetase [Clostridium sp. USBA 49]
MTEKLYYIYPYIKEWEADVLDISEKEGKFLIELNKTAFYPEGGGQPSDKGYIDDVEVLHVFEEDEHIFHVTNKKPKNSKVICKLDFERRYDLMQQHTGQHILSAVFYNNFKGETSSFHLGEDYVSIDISMPEMTEELIKIVEDEVNKIIYSNLEIKSYIVNKNELENIPLRKLPKVEKDIRIVEIDKIDYSPCCGTHLKNTGEIGVIKIIKIEKYKGVTRVYFKCGKRAFEDYQFKHDITVNLGKLLSVDQNNLESKVKNISEELKNKIKEIKELKENLNLYEAEDILNRLNSNIVNINFSDKTFDDVQNIGRIILRKGNYLVILSSNIDKKLWLAHNGDFEVNCGKLFKENLQKFSGRGGGGDKQAQASFESEISLKEFQEFVVSKIYNND